MPWSTSTRRTELPRNWATIRKRVLIRDRYRCQAPACASRATDVDHIVRGAGDDDANLQSLCADHHRAKTVAEAHDAMRQQRAKARHPVEQHPGMRPRQR